MQVECESPELHIFLDFPLVQTVNVTFTVAFQLRSLKIPLGWSFLYHGYRLAGKKMLKGVIPSEKPRTLMGKVA